MKRILLFAAAVLFGVSACRKDELPDYGSGKQMDVSVSANIPAEMQLARSNDDPGAGDMVNRCIMEIYHLKGDAYEKYGEREVVALNEKAATFNVRLVAGQTYKFVFWADHANGNSGSGFTDNHYNTTDLANVSIADVSTYTGNDDTRDAFFGMQEVTMDVAKELKVTLQRPFGQLNISTLDMNEIPDESSKPTKVDIRFESVYTAINLLTGELIGTPTALNYSENVLLAGNGKLSVDYIFAKANEQYLAKFTMGFFNDGGESVAAAYNFTDIPVRRNYKTNVSGNLLTKKADVLVTVDPVFNVPDVSKEIIEVPTVAAANTALQTGAKHIVITEAPTEDATITLPKYEEAKEEVSITLPATEKQVTIEYSSATEGQKTNAPAVLNVTVPTAGKVVINAPESTVKLNGETYNEVTAKTAENTLIIGSGVTVKKLTLEKGNVKIYGKVDALTKDQGWKGEIVRCVATQSDLDNALTDAVTDYAYLLIEDPVTGLNGGGKTLTKRVEIAADAELSNLTINTPKGSSVTLAADDINVMLDGLTIYQQANDGSNNCAILAANHNNLTLLVKNSHLIVPKSSQRGINIHGATDPASVCTVTLDNTHVGSTLEVMGVDEYTDEQNTRFKGLYDLRGISIASHAGNVIIKMQNNSVIEGVFYAINSVQHNDNFEIYVDNSRLDGRCAFNIWSDGKGIFNVTNSILIGRNPFTGSTEDFATIVICGKDGSWAGAANNTITVKNSEIYCYNKPEVETNFQYAADMRSPRKNVLNLLGTTKIYDKSATTRLPHAVEMGNWINEVNIDPTVTMEGNVTNILPSNVWTGYSVAYPAPAADGITYIGTPEQLAVVTAQEIKDVNVVIVRDLDMNNQAWEAKNISNVTIDGQGHTISNLRSENKGYAGLLGFAVSAKIKNLTLKDATITATETIVNGKGDQNAYAGGFISACYGSTVVENCVLDGCTVQGINKVGGIVGFNAEDGMTIRNCTVQNSTIKTDDMQPEHGQCGGILGYVGITKNRTTLITGNYVINTKVEAAENTIEGETHRHSSIYVGTFQGSTGDNLTIEAPTNAIRNSTFNGEAPNTSKYMGLLGGLRFTETIATTTVLTINGKRYTE